MKIKSIYESNEKHYLKEVRFRDLEQSVDENLYVSTVIYVDTKIRHQNIEGFGASITDSSAHLINKHLSNEDKDIIMKDLFTLDGINISMIRNAMGASDYAVKYYNYQETKEDNFDLGHDRIDVLPITKKAYELNDNLTVMASPWSAPGWMKTSNSMVGGTLNNDQYENYAQYFVKYIHQMKEEGIEIKYVTPQNEPMFVPKNYPGMYMDATMQMEFVSKYLKPTFKEHKISTKILGYDHNWDRTEYPLALIEEGSVDGIAWHWYGGDVKVQKIIHDIDPTKEVFFTEGSGGEWIPEFEPAFSNLMRSSIEILRNRSRSLILWNLALDEENGPFVPGFGKSTCRGLVKIDKRTNQYEYTIDYYGLAHFSKFVPKYSYVIESNASDGMSNIVFEAKNEYIVVLYNDDNKTKRTKILIDDTTLTFDIFAKSAYTIVLERGS